MSFPKPPVFAHTKRKDVLNHFPGLPLGAPWLQNDIISLINSGIVRSSCSLRNNHPYSFKYWHWHVLGTPNFHLLSERFASDSLFIIISQFIFCVSPVHRFPFIVRPLMICNCRRWISVSSSWSLRRGHGKSVESRFSSVPPLLLSTCWR